MWRSFISLLIGLFFVAEGYGQDFEVDYVHIDVFINAEGYFDVVENYDITFTSPKHGIFRTIQTNYDLVTAEGDQEKRKIEIKEVEVPGHKFSTDFGFVQKVTDNFEIKIGDKNKT